MIETNSSNEAVVDGGIKLYSGIAPMKVIAVNPTMVQLHELGLDFIKQEQNYTNIMIGETPHNKVVFWLKNTENNITTKAEFLVRNELRTNKIGTKHQWVNNEGKFAWGEVNPGKGGEGENYDWFKNEGVREAYYGEENLTGFIRALFNVRNGANCKVDANTFNNDVTSLNAAHAAVPENEVRCLLGVRDDKYQEVYTHHFGRIKPKKDSYFANSLKDEYKQFKAEYNPTLTFGEWDGSVPMPSPAVAAVPAGGSMF
jgi:hypothetical protein|tara:strand:- start:4728 stop:5498 length:771 start_codon:yes stop_codon:yes gene_type:complete